MNNDIFSHIENISNHGAAQGILPRFFNQMFDLAKMSIGRNELDNQFKKYFKTVIPELIHFYDLYHKLIDAINDYQAGVKQGTYYTLDERNRSTLDKTKEREIGNLINDFFIRGKITIVNFVKSGIISDENFNFGQYYFCDQGKLEQKITDYYANTDGRYLPLLKLLNNANSDFLSSFNKIRGEIEHNQFFINPFQISKTEHRAFVVEPMLTDKPLSMQLEFYYNSILELIEKLLAYYLGINGEILKNGFLLLHIRTDFNYPETKSKYVFSLGGIPSAFPTIRCKYD